MSVCNIHWASCIEWHHDRRECINPSFSCFTSSCVQWDLLISVDLCLLLSSVLLWCTISPVFCGWWPFWFWMFSSATSPASSCIFVHYPKKMKQSKLITLLIPTHKTHSLRQCSLFISFSFGLLHCALSSFPTSPSLFIKLFHSARLPFYVFCFLFHFFTCFYLRQVDRWMAWHGMELQ